MKKPLLFIGILLVLGCLNSLAHADYYSREFGDMDTSYDDFVNFEEYRYYNLGATVEAFERIDTDHDKKIDFYEWVEYQESQNPFKSKSEFRYNGKNGVWYIDRDQNRYRDTYGHRIWPGNVYWTDYWHHRRHYRWHDPWRHRRHRNHLSFSLGSHLNF